MIGSQAWEGRSVNQRQSTKSNQSVGIEVGELHKEASAGLR